jgi:hypothetical protein
MNEWREGHRHVHIVVRAGDEIQPNLVSDLWAKVHPGPKSSRSCYCRHVQNPAGLARYLVKNIKDAAKKEVAPKSYGGRVMTYSRGFLTRPMEVLWREELNDWNLRRSRQLS